MRKHTTASAEKCAAKFTKQVFAILVLWGKYASDPVMDSID